MLPVNDDSQKVFLSNAFKNIKLGQLGGTFPLKDSHFWHFLGRLKYDLIWQL